MQDILFLSQRIPYPPNKGDKIRSFHVLRELCRHSRVHLGCFVDDAEDWQHLPMLRQMVTSCHAEPLSKRHATLRSTRAFLTGEALSLPYYYDPRMADWVRSTVADVHPSAAYIFSSPMAQYVSKEIRVPRLVMDFVDMDSQKWEDYAARRPWPLSSIYRREGRALLAYEQKVAGIADAGIFVSGPEKNLFDSFSPETASHIHAISNGIDSSYFSPDREYPCPFDNTQPTLVFTGAMDYWPNIEAVSWFAKTVLPLVRKTIPDVRFVVVGLNPTPDVIALNKIAGVTVTGRVPDVRPYLAYADVIVAPLLTARGVQNKVLEAMAMAKTVVTTRQALEGIDARPERHLLVANGAPNFAAMVTRAIANPRAAAMGLAARELICQTYAWEPQLAKFRRLVLNEGYEDGSALLAVKKPATAA